MLWYWVAARSRLLGSGELGWVEPRGVYFVCLVPMRWLDWRGGSIPLWLFRLLLLTFCFGEGSACRREKVSVGRIL